MFPHIRDLREDADLTQQQMAGMLHISQATYSRYESGTATFPPEVLIQLAQFYKTSVDYLLGLTNDRRPQPGSPPIRDVSKETM